MDDKLLNFAKNLFDKPYFELEEKDGSLIFKLKNKIPFSRNFLIVKHRNSGKRISIEMKNSKAVLTREKLLKIDHNMFFDVYLKIRLFGKVFYYRIKFNEQNIGKYIFDKENDFYFDSYPTIHGNLSFEYYEAKFYPVLEDIEFNDTGFIMKGTVILGNDVEFDNVEVAAISEVAGRRIFPCEFERNGQNVSFKTDVQFEFGIDEVDTDWEFKVRLINQGLVLNSQTVKAYALSDFKTHGSFIFGKIDCDEIDDIKPCIYVHSNPKYKFKVQILPYEKYESRIKSANIKDWYEKYQKDPVENNLIFFESFHGKYNNNPKYLYEKMLDLGLDKKYDIVWSYDGEDSLPGNPIIVNSDEEEYYKHLAHAKYRISNATFPIIEPRGEINFLQTWHGTPLKRLGTDITVKNTGIGWGHFNQEVPTWDYLITANEYSTRTFRRAFNFKQEILEYGYPANDVFYTKDESFIQNIKDSLGIDSTKKIMLYAPTFRDDKKDEFGNRYFELDLDLEYLKENLKDDYILIIKTHSAISEALEIDDNLKGFVYDLSDYDDIHELFIISDILITDYSSVFFDFAHSRRPIIFFTPDMETYINSRGLYYEVFEDMPGPQVINNEGLLEAIENIDSISEEFEENYDKFYNKYCIIGNGDSSEKIIKIFLGEN